VNLCDYYLIIIATSCLGIEVALVFWWVKKRIDWLRDVLVPLLARAHRDLAKVHRDIQEKKL
jgi:hypothetical protein